MEYIRVKGVSSKDIAKIVLLGNKITVKSKSRNTIEFLGELIEKWKLDNKMDDAKIFKIIPDLASYYSRLFFSDIIKGGKS